MKYRADIDGLRALAVIPVILFHSHVPGFGGGFVGVDIFFVISGYLITALIVGELDQGSFSILSFYERRVRRIIPLLFTVLTVSTIIAYIFFLPVEFTDFSRSLVATTLFGSNFSFSYEAGYFDAPAQLKPLLHTWSLAVEEQFYIGFPLILILCHRFFGTRWINCILPILIASFLLSVWAVTNKPAAAFYLIPTRAWELLLGSLLAVGAVQRSSNRALHEIAGLSGLALIAYSVLSLSKHSTFPGLNALYPCVGAALVIWSGHRGDTITSRILSIRPLVFIGLISYSLYLWHWPALVFTSYIKMRELLFSELVLLLYFVAVLSWASWRFIETPVRRSLYWKGRPLAVVSILFGVVFLTFGGVMIASNGFSGRIAPDALRIMAEAKAEQATEPQRIFQADCPYLDVKRQSGRFCVRGRGGQEASFVLVGDSHAGAMSTGVFLAAERLGLSGYQYTDSGFRPLPGVSEVGAIHREELVSGFFEFLRKHSSVKLILFAGFWEIQATGRSYRHRNKLFLDDSYDGSGLAYNKHSFRRGLKKLLQMFPNRTFALIEDIPSGRQLSIRRAARLAHIRGVEFFNQDAFGIARKKYEAQIATYRDILKSAAEVGNGFVVPVIDILCDSEFCSGIRNKKLLYRNADHLSKAGSALFADKLYGVLVLGLGLGLDSGSVGSKRSRLKNAHPR